MQGGCTSAAVRTGGCAQAAQHGGSEAPALLVAVVVHGPCCAQHGWCMTCAAAVPRAFGMAVRRTPGS